MEDYAYILDYLPQGRAEHRRFKREPLAYGIGDQEYKLLELVPKDEAMLIVGEKVYIGKEMDRRDQILHVKRRVGFEELTHTGRSELPYVIQEIVKTGEKRFVRFYNEAHAITTRFHMLELLPGLGKKTMWTILDERKKGDFADFKDIENRAGIHHPEKFIAKRLELELSDPHQKYKIFAVK